MSKINSRTLNYCYSLHVVCATRSICDSFCCWNKYMLNNCSYCVMEYGTYTRGTSVFPDIHFTGGFTGWHILYLKVYTLKKYGSRKSTFFFPFYYCHLKLLFHKHAKLCLCFKNHVSIASDSLLPCQHNVSFFQLLEGLNNNTSRHQFTTKTVAEF